MKRAAVDGITLEYEVSGTGEPVILIHGALIADTFQPLLTEPSLAGRYCLINYHRRGYMGSTHSIGPTSLGEHAADCRALLRHLGMERAHAVGHSFGGSVALQFGLDFPEAVHSLALLEPALFLGATARAYRDALATGEQRFVEESAAVVVDEFLRPRFGAEYGAMLDKVLPGGFAQAVADAGTWFGKEIPALRRWRFDEAELRRITQPVLAVLGGESDALWPRFGETQRQLLRSLTQVQGFVLPGATHALQLQNPRGMAEALADYYRRHPIPVRSSPVR